MLLFHMCVACAIFLQEDEGPPGVTELVEYSDLARACAEEMEAVTVTITGLRNELEATRDNRKLQELEDALNRCAN